MDLRFIRRRRRGYEGGRQTGLKEEKDNRKEKKRGSERSRRQGMGKEGEMGDREERKWGQYN